MAMTPGQPVEDLSSNDVRFYLVEVLAHGAHHDIVVAEDRHLDDKRVAIKSIRYPDVRDDDAIRYRRQALRNELDLLTLPSPLLPEPLDWLTVRNADVPDDLADAEPLLVYELQHGQALHLKLGQAAPEGVSPDRALRMVREIALFLRLLHEREFVFRCLAPEHLIIDLDDIIHVVGVGNALQMGVVPNVFRQTLEHPFVAPELREVDDVQQLRPAADIYSLGALLAYLLTGREPLLVVESPFDDVAYHRLGGAGPGLAKLVARMTHANPRKRFQDIDGLLRHLDPNRLPDPAHADLASVELPSPWKVPPAVGPASGISAGPLVSTPAAQAAEVDKPPAVVEDQATAMTQHEKRLVVIASILGGISLLSVIGLILFALL